MGQVRSQDVPFSFAGLFSAPHPQSCPVSGRQPSAGFSLRTQAQTEGRLLIARHPEAAELSKLVVRSLTSARLPTQNRLPSRLRPGPAGSQVNVSVKVFPLLKGRACETGRDGSRRGHGTAFCGRATPLTSARAPGSRLPLISVFRKLKRLSVQ